MSDRLVEKCGETPSLTAFATGKTRCCVPPLTTVVPVETGHFHRTFKQVYDASRRELPYQKNGPLAVNRGRQELLEVYWNIRIEPHRVCGRPFRLSYAAKAGSSSVA
jgi:hypothetical protein